MTRTHGRQEGPASQWTTTTAPLRLSHPAPIRQACGLPPLLQTLRRLRKCGSGPQRTAPTQCGRMPIAERQCGSCGHCGRPGRSLGSRHMRESAAVPSHRGVYKAPRAPTGAVAGSELPAPRPARRDPFAPGQAPRPPGFVLALHRPHPGRAKDCPPQPPRGARAGNCLRPVTRPRRPGSKIERGTPCSHRRPAASPCT